MFEWHYRPLVLALGPIGEPRPRVARAHKSPPRAHHLAAARLPRRLAQARTGARVRVRASSCAGAHAPMTNLAPPATASTARQHSSGRCAPTLACVHPMRPPRIAGRQAQANRACAVGRRSHGPPRAAPARCSSRRARRACGGGRARAAVRAPGRAVPRCSNGCPHISLI